MSYIGNPKYLEECELRLTPTIALIDQSGQTVVQLSPGTGNGGSGIALIRDAAGDFKSLSVSILSSVLDKTKGSNLSILNYLFQRIREYNNKNIYLAAYGQHYGLVKEGRKHVLYLGSQDIAIVSTKKKEIDLISLLEPFDTGTFMFVSYMKTISGQLLQQQY